MVFTCCRVCKCYVVASDVLMYALCLYFIEYINKEGYIHLLDAKAGGLTLYFEKKKSYITYSGVWNNNQFLRTVKSATESILLFLL